MKHTSKTSKLIPAILLTGAMMAVCSWAFGRDGSISDSVKNLSGTITVKDASSNAFAGASVIDEPGNYSGGIPSLRNYTALASKREYDLMSTPNQFLHPYQGTIYHEFARSGQALMAIATSATGRGRLVLLAADQSGYQSLCRKGELERDKKKGLQLIRQPLGG